MAQLIQICEPGETPEPHENEGSTPTAIGIDLGTTNSVVAVSSKQSPKVLRDEDGEALVPSVVAYAADGSAIVGGAAKWLLLDRPENVVSSVKRLMGRGGGDLESLAGTIPYDIDEDGGENGEGEGGGMVRLNIAGRKLSPVEISAEILGFLKSRAETILGTKVDRAVITVPAYFDDAARTATRDAARLAGMEVLRLVNEPTAAALAYGLDNQAEGIYAVYDLGGGTFDISLLKMTKGVFQVLATGGDAALGGDDFDRAVAEHFISSGEEHAPMEEPVDRQQAKVALMTARMAKECLTTSEDGEWMFDIGDKQTMHRLNRDEFDKLIAPLVERTITICQGVLDDARLSKDDIKGVVLVGGSTRIPLVRRRVAEFFGRQPLKNINPDEVVAVGAALQAEALTSGTGNLLIDVTPLSLGIETMGGLVEKVIPRNTPVPVAKAQEFTTFQDGQGAMSIHVVQGEREMSDQCRSLARFELHGIPPMTAGAARIRVTFSVDADGLLTVTACEDTTGIEQKVDVKPSYGLSDEEVTDMLYDSMKYAKDDMELRLLTEARVEAERTITALSVAMAMDRDLLLENEAETIEEVVIGLRNAMEGNDRDVINAFVEKLETATKPFAERRMERGIRQALKGVDVDELKS